MLLFGDPVQCNFSRYNAGGWFTSKTAGKSALAEASLEPHVETPRFAAS